MHIRIRYHNKTTEKLCTDFKTARKKLPMNVAEKLHGLINLVESADTLHDIAEMQIYYPHPLRGKSKGRFALDIAGRKAGYRLIITPLDDNGNRWKEKNTNVVYRATRLIMVWEVSNHYG